MRLERARKLLNKLKESGYAGRIVFYSDEKNFIMDPVYNAQNDRYINFFESDEDKERTEETAAILPGRSTPPPPCSWGLWPP